MHISQAARRPMAYGPGIPDEKFSGRTGRRNFPRPIPEEKDFSAQNAVAGVGAKLFVAVVWVATAGFAVYLIHQVWASVIASFAGAIR